MGINALNNTITLVGRIFDTRQAVHPIYPDTSEKPPRTLAAIRQPFPRITPEEAGVSSDLIADFLSEIRMDASLNMHSLLILRNGRMLAEAAFGDQDLRCWKCTFSACKSITALAIGMLIAEGKLSLNDRLIDLFEARIPARSRLSMKELTVRHLLTMSSGASFNELSMMTERDWTKGYLAGSFDPGRFSYNSLNTYLLSVIVTERSGESLSDYLRPRLFEALDISNYYWEKSPTGVDKGGWGLYICPEDLAKIGQLVLQNGVWQGRQLVPADWIAEASSTQISTGDVSDFYDYGYHIWTGRRHNSFLFNGMLGQNVLGFRDNGILLVSHAGNDELFQQSRYFPLAEKYFGRAFADSLPSDEKAHDRLTKTIASLRDPLPAAATVPAKKRGFGRLFRPKSVPASPPSLPEECGRLHGIRFTADDENAPGAGLAPVVLQAVQNNYAAGLASISFLQSGDAFYMTYTEQNAGYFLQIGFDEAKDSDVTLNGVPYHVKTFGRFTHNEDGEPLLLVRVNFCETPLTRVLKLYYTGASPRLEQSERPGAPFIYSKVLLIKRELLAAPIIGDTVNLLDNDYLRYRVDRKFHPTLRLTPSAIVAEHPK